MKCPNCGYEIEKPNKKTCPCCGASIKTITAQPAEEAKQPEPLIQEPVRPEPPKQEAPPTAEPQQACPRCKKAVPDGFNFCPHCGYEMREPAETTPVKEIPLAARNASQTVSEEFLRSEPTPVLEEQEPEIKSGPRHYEPQYPPYEVEPEHDEPEPEHYQPEPKYDEHNNSDYGEEDEENPEMGGYYPYPGEEPTGETGEDFTEHTTTGTSMSWLTIVITTVVSLLIGALLYFIFN